jgi:hypothetical protein
MECSSWFFSQHTPIDRARAIDVVAFEEFCFRAIAIIAVAFVRVLDETKRTRKRVRRDRADDEFA